MFDKLLVRPSVLELSAALAEAGGGERSFWEGRVTRLPERREGRHYWKKDRTGLAWWTDHQNRRHFRVVGQYEQPFWPDSWPPISNVYPEPCILRGIGSEAPAWVFLCDCGAVVPAGADSWSGPRCAACQGLVEQGETPSRQAGIIELDWAGYAAPFLGGHLVLVQHDGDSGRVLVRNTGGEVVRKVEGLRVDAPFAASPDSRHLVSYGPRNRFRIHDLETGELLHDEPHPQLQWLQFSPSGTVIAASDYYTVTLYDFDPLSGGLRERDHWEGRCSIAWSPDGRRLAIAGLSTFSVKEGDKEMAVGGEVVPLPSILPVPSFDVNNPVPCFNWMREWLPQVQQRVESHSFGLPQVAFSEDGNELTLLRFCLDDPAPPTPEFDVTRWRWTGTRWSRIGWGNVPASKRVALSPEGRWVAIDRRLVEVYDTATGAKLGEVGWPAEDSESDKGWSPRFTADGRSLLVSYGYGLYVVPWADLLGVPS